MLTLVVVLKLWAEIALFSLAGRSLLSLLLGARSSGNLVFELLGVVTRPVVSGVRRMLPGTAKPQHLTVVAALALGVLWLAATLGKVWICLGQGLGQCR